jgi:hypothetical protein
MCGESTSEDGTGSTASSADRLGDRPPNDTVSLALDQVRTAASPFPLDSREESSSTLDYQEEAGAMRAIDRYGKTD